MVTLMQEKLLNFTSSLSNRSLLIAIFLFFFCTSIVRAERGRTFFSDDQIILPSGVRTTITRVDDNHHVLALLKDDRVIWAKVMGYSYGREWKWAYFTPIKRGKVPAHDINNDGYYEVAVIVFEGGIYPALHKMIIFTVKADRLEYLREQRFNTKWDAPYRCRSNVEDYAARSESRTPTFPEKENCLNAAVQ